jgi:hypothetical protein
MGIGNKQYKKRYIKGIYKGNIKRVYGKYCGFWPNNPNWDCLQANNK